MSATAAPTATRPAQRVTLWKLILLAAGAHVLVILIFSPSLFFSRGESLEDLYARGEEAMNQGRHAEAVQIFRKVLDAQPKPAPIFVRAAEQHRLADRMLRQANEASATPRPAEGQPTPPTPAPRQPTEPEVPGFNAPGNVTRPAPGNRPTGDDIPPELRGR